MLSVKRYFDNKKTQAVNNPTSCWLKITTKTQENIQLYSLNKASDQF